MRLYEEGKVHRDRDVATLKEAGSGIAIKGLCSKHGISDATNYNRLILLGYVDGRPVVFS